MLRKLLSLGAVIVVAVAFGAGTASAKQPPAKGTVDSSCLTGTDGFSDGRLLGNGTDGFSDGRLLR
jgi:hypothetical protein